MHAGLRRLNWIMLVVNGRCRACQVEDLLHLHVQGKRDVVTHELEVRLAEQVLHIGLGSGEEVVDA
jgi:hypothetical protein